MTIKSNFYYDFYFNGKFVRRFYTIERAKRMITWPLLRTYPVNLWEIKKVKKRKLSTEKKHLKNQSLIQKSILKNEKLSTGVQNFAPYSEKIAPHIKKKENKIKNLKKEKRKKGFPALKAGKGSTLETTRHTPNLLSGVAKEEKSEKASVDSLLVSAWQKNGYPLQPKLDNK